MDIEFVIQILMSQIWWVCQDCIEFGKFRLQEVSLDKFYWLVICH